MIDIGILPATMGYWWELPSGKRLHNELERSTIYHDIVTIIITMIILLVLLSLLYISSGYD